MAKTWVYVEQRDLLRLYGRTGKARTWVYIASPYTIGDRLANVIRQIDVATWLMDEGYHPVWPLHSHFMHERHPRSWEEWMKRDMEMLAKCDCLLRLPGQSRGADLEVEEARRLGLAVYGSVEELVRCEGRVRSPARTDKGGTR